MRLYKVRRLQPGVNTRSNEIIRSGVAQGLDIVKLRWAYAILTYKQQ